MKLDKLSDEPLATQPEGAPGIHGPDRRVADEGHSALHRCY